MQLRILVSRLRATTANPVLLRTTYSEDEPCVCADTRALAAAMSRAVQRLSTQLQQDVYNAVADSVADRR